MPLSDTDIYVRRSNEQIRRDTLAALRAQFGAGVSPKRNTALIEFTDTVGQLPLADIDDDIESAHRQTILSMATGQNIDAILDPLGFFRLGSARSTGDVDVVFGSLPVSPDPLFSVGDLVFVDKSGALFDMVEDFALPDAPASYPVTHAIKLRARNAGGDGNIEPSSLTDVIFSGPTAQSLWNDHVDSYNNDESFVGGRLEESDRDYLLRYGSALSAVPSPAIGGIVAAVRDGVEGVTGVSPLENTDPYDGSSRDRVFDSDETGTASESIDATNTRISQRIVTTDRRFVQHFTAKLASDTDLVGTIRIETDNAGSPSGVLANARFEKTGLDFDGTNLTAGLFDKGAYLPAGTYHVVFLRTSGSGTFDGGAGGTADQVKFFDGTWKLSTLVENLNMEVIGGVPPRSFRLFVSGDFVAKDVADAIIDSRTPGIISDGLVSAVSHRGTTERWDEPVPAPMVLDVEVQVTQFFDADANAIKDALVAYIGGTDTKNVTRLGLPVDKDFIWTQAIGHLTGGAFPGLLKVSVLEAGRKASFATPADLTSAQEDDVPSALDTELTIEDVATDIRISIVEV